tara:strand:- start:7839 stop:8456 length:618 start_codon:yes stop_codon:yes gene_type:complete
MTATAFRPLIIFAKAPVPGTVKTRLIPALGPEGACDLYSKLLRHTLENTRDWPGERYLYCAPDTEHPSMRALADDHQLILRTQKGMDLGERMARALADYPGGALLIGTDCPLLGCQHLIDANHALHTQDTAIIPSEDGGYVLIAQRAPHPAPFTAMAWSHENVLADTQLRLANAGLTLWLGPTLWDLDEPADLPRLTELLHPKSF